MNEKLVTNVDEIDNTKYIEWDNGDIYTTNIKNDKQIKTILTKQKYKQNCYEVEEQV